LAQVAVTWVEESIETEDAGTPMNAALAVYPVVKKFVPVNTI